MCSKAQDIYIFEKPVILFTVCSCCSKSVNQEDLSHRAMAQTVYIVLDTSVLDQQVPHKGQDFYLTFTVVLNVNHPSIFSSCSFEDVPLVEFQYLVFSCMPGESCHR